jgi:hypothetical protein
MVLAATLAGAGRASSALTDSAALLFADDYRHPLGDSFAAAAALDPAAIDIIACAPYYVAGFALCDDLVHFLAFPLSACSDKTNL